MRSAFSVTKRRSLLFLSAYLLIYPVLTFYPAVQLSFLRVFTLWRVPAPRRRGVGSGRASFPFRSGPFLFPAGPVLAFHFPRSPPRHFLTAHAQLLLALACSCLLLLTMAVGAGYCLLWRGIACYVVAGGGYWRRGGRGRGGAFLLGSPQRAATHASCLGPS